ncbi:MAG: hypothetical protein CFH44_00305 [Proteobacteria bacterium]|nr:MAG: hypothetical protein CFH44_00305 [Pseudomonadota bacterium]
MNKVQTRDFIISTIESESVDWELAVKAKSHLHYLSKEMDTGIVEKYYNIIEQQYAFQSNLINKKIILLPKTSLHDSKACICLDKLKSKTQALRLQKALTSKLMYILGVTSTLS